MQQVVDFWNTEGMVYAAGGSIEGTAMGENGDPLVAGDCMMHRQASFYGAFITNAGASFGQEEGQVDTFYFPANEGTPTLVGGIVPGAMRDAPEVWAVMQYLASPEFANARQAAQSEINADVGVSGFLTANLNADQSLWNDLEQVWLEMLASGDPLAYDGSDLMPGEVGTGTFWSEGVALVSGEIDAQNCCRQHRGVVAGRRSGGGGPCHDRRLTRSVHGQATDRRAGSGHHGRSPLAF